MDTDSVETSNIHQAVARPHTRNHQTLNGGEKNPRFIHWRSAVTVVTEMKEETHLGWEEMLIMSV